MFEELKKKKLFAREQEKPHLSKVVLSLRNQARGGLF